MNTLLTIAGSDSIGGAGVEADIKTACSFGVFAMTAITAVTVQNTLGVKSMTVVPPDAMCEAVIAVVEDSAPDAVKIGMLPSGDHIIMLSELIRDLKHSGKLKNIVVDPVMRSTSGFSLSGENYDSADFYMNHLTPLADVVTPNLPEAEAFLRHAVNPGDFSYTAPVELIRRLGSGAVVLKGGHAPGNFSVDMLIERVDGADDKEFVLSQFAGEKISTSNLHGTGCAFSSAIACGLAKGMTVKESVRKAKIFLSDAIKLGAGIDRFKGNGPLYLLPDESKTIL